MDEQKKIPRHVAIIMDGNGRWAESCREKWVMQKAVRY